MFIIIRAEFKQEFENPSLDRLFCRPLVPSPLTGEVRVRVNKMTGNRFDPLPLIPSREGRGNLIFDVMPAPNSS
jgi:hypothetical protein